MSGLIINDFDGIVHPEVETLIKNLGIFSSKDMENADNTALNNLIQSVKSNEGLLDDASKSLDVIKADLRLFINGKLDLKSIVFN